MCVRTSGFEVFGPKDEVPVPYADVSGAQVCQGTPFASTAVQSVMKARNNSAVQASEIGSIASEAACVRVYDYMGVALNMFSVCGSVMDTDIIVCVCVVCVCVWCVCVWCVCVCGVCGVCVVCVCGVCVCVWCVWCVCVCV